MHWPNDVFKPQIHHLRPSRTLCSRRKQVSDFKALKAMIALGIKAGIKDKKIKNCKLLLEVLLLIKYCNH